MEILHTLRAGDAVIARLHDDSSNRNVEKTVDAIVVHPMSIGAGGNATMLVELLLPDGQREQRTVPAADLQLPQRRSRRGPASRLGDSDGWGEVPDRCWATSATADAFEHASSGHLPNERMCGVRGTLRGACVRIKLGDCVIAARHMEDGGHRLATPCTRGARGSGGTCHEGSSAARWSGQGT